MDRQDRDEIIKSLDKLYSLKTELEGAGASSKKYRDKKTIAAAKEVRLDAKDTAAEVILYTETIFKQLAPSKIDLTDWQTYGGRRVKWFTAASSNQFSVNVMYVFTKNDRSSRHGKFAAGVTRDGIKVIGFSCVEKRSNGSAAYADTRLLAAPIDFEGKRTAEDWRRVQQHIAERKAMVSRIVRAFKFMVNAKCAELNLALQEHCKRA